MYPICSGQIKAARALLGWSQDDLATAAGLSVNTIRNIELGHISPRNSTNHTIRQAIENAGLEFTEGEGVKRRNDAVKIYRGSDGYESFLDDIEHTARKQGGDIGIILKSQDVLQSLQGVSVAGAQRLEELSKITVVKCLLCEIPESKFIMPPFQFRMTSKLNAGPLPGFIYGDKYALMLVESFPVPEFVVFNLAGVAQSYRNHFLLLWETGQPFLAPTDHKQKSLVEN